MKGLWISAHGRERGHVTIYFRLYFRQERGQKWGRGCWRKFQSLKHRFIKESILQIINIPTAQWRRALRGHHMSIYCCCALLRGTNYQLKNFPAPIKIVNSLTSVPKLPGTVDFRNHPRPVEAELGRRNNCNNTRRPWFVGDQIITLRRSVSSDRWDDPYHLFDSLSQFPTSSVSRSKRLTVFYYAGKRKV